MTKTKADVVMEGLAVADWLAAMSQVTNAQPVAVTIGKETYSGARYTETLHYDASMTAVQRGERKAGEAYTREFIYLLGGLPAAYRRSTRVVFTVDGDKREWYVSCYHDGRDAPNKPPFTPNFMLAPWDVPNGEAIDHYDVLGGKKPYRRVAVTVK